MKFFKFILLLTVFFVLFGCGKTDKIDLPLGDYKRIVSLSPSITRQILSLDEESRLVGVTSYHPKLKTKKKIVGTLVNPNFEVILSLKPDLILYSAEDSATQKVEGLSGKKIKIYRFSKNTNFKSLCDHYLLLGKILNKEEKAKKDIIKYERKYVNLQKPSMVKSAAFFVATSPIITVSNNSFIGAILKSSGVKNIYGGLKLPYPVVTLESLIKLNPDIIISMSFKGDVFFKEIKDKFPAMKFKIFNIKPDNIAYYTPENFLNAIEEITSFLN